MKTGIELIAEERQRQISVEGWTPEYDEIHFSGELAEAAGCYAFNAASTTAGTPGEWHPDDAWPWAVEWWKPGDPIRDLVKAGALIAAEIDRVQRLGAK